MLDVRERYPYCIVTEIPMNHGVLYKRRVQSIRSHLLLEMDLVESHEASLRTYMDTRTKALQNEIEETARNRDSLTTNALEEQIDNQADHFISDVNKRLNQMREDIRARRPTNDQHPDYPRLLAQYHQFVMGASVAVQRVTSWVNTIFDRITKIINDILQWIIDGANTVLGILEIIRNSFNEFSRILSK